MKLSLGLRSGVFILSLAFLGLAGLASDKITDQAKVYQAELDQMLGQAPMTIVDKLTEWKFERSGAFMADNPTSKDIGKQPMS